VCVCVCINTKVFVCEPVAVSKYVCVCVFMYVIACVRVLVRACVTMCDV